MSYTIRTIQQEDYPSLAEIYQQGLDTGIATFETEIPTWKYWDKAHLQIGRTAAWRDNEMAGWAALAPVSTRAVYVGVAEVSIYISTTHRGKGLGHLLLQQLISVSEQNGLWTLQSGIFPQNIGSIELHKKNGFRKIGYRERIAQRNGSWQDNVLMERRSKVVGV